MQGCVHSWALGRQSGNPLKHWSGGGVQSRGDQGSTAIPICYPQVNKILKSLPNPPALLPRPFMTIQITLHLVLPSPVFSLSILFILLSHNYFFNCKLVILLPSLKLFSNSPSPPGQSPNSNGCFRAWLSVSFSSLLTALGGMDNFFLCLCYVLYLFKLKYLSHFVAFIYFPDSPRLGSPWGVHIMSWVNV